MTRVATTGSPASIASRAASGMPSCSDGRTKTSAASSSARASPRCPASSTWSPTPSAATCACSASCRWPPPTSTTDSSGKRSASAGTAATRWRWPFMTLSRPTVSTTSRSASRPSAARAAARPGPSPRARIPFGTVVNRCGGTPTRSYVSRCACDTASRWSTGSIDASSRARLRWSRIRHGRCTVCSTTGTPARRAARAPSKSSRPVPTCRWKTSAGCSASSPWTELPNAGSRGWGSGRGRAPTAAARSSRRRPGAVGQAISETSRPARTCSVARSSMCAPIPDGSAEGVYRHTERTPAARSRDRGAPAEGAESVSGTVLLGQARATVARPGRPAPAAAPASRWRGATPWAAGRPRRACSPAGVRRRVPARHRMTAYGHGACGPRPAPGPRPRRSAAPGAGRAGPALELVAEGVETEPARERLAVLGCPQAQGSCSVARSVPTRSGSGVFDPRLGAVR